jgi:RHS repeat-associated protein
VHIAQTNEIHFIYDGNVVIQERNTNNTPLVTYTRGVGGLLARTDANGSTYYHADGNGNITMLLDASQNIVAKYLYDPFGNILSQSGSLANANVYRFASKEWNANADFYYFGRRYYDPMLQRFLNRDPMQQQGGLNLYAYCGNNPVSLIDILGLCDQSTWDLFWQNIYDNGLQNTVEYAKGLGLDALSLALMDYQLQSNPGLFAYNTLAYGASQAGIASTDPSAYAYNLWNGIVNTATTSQGIGQITGGIELGLFTGNVISLTAAEETPFLQVTPPEGTFGSGNFGNAMHQAIADELQTQFPDVTFDEINIKPGQNGVDIVVNDADVNTVGFKYGEIKPNSTSGQNTFNRQVQNWQNNGTIPQNATVQPITYDANGNVNLGFRP